MRSSIRRARDSTLGLGSLAHEGIAEEFGGAGVGKSLLLEVMSGQWKGPPNALVRAKECMLVSRLEPPPFPPPPSIIHDDER